MSEIKKTLLITIDFPPQKGGVANYLANICDNLPEDKIVVLANAQEGDQSFDAKQKYKIIRKNLFYKRFWPKWLKILPYAREVIANEKIEQVIISHVLPVGYIALLLKLPFFVILHGYDFLAAQKSEWKKTWLKMILARAQHVIVNSSFTKKKVISSKINPNEISIIYPCPNTKEEDINEVEIQLIKKELELEDKKVLLSVGRLVKRKGIDNVIKALPKVIEQIPNLVYLIIGSGEYKKELEDLAERLKVRGNIIFLEDIKDTNLPCYYILADIFIQPARAENKADVEGFGIVYIEANLFSKPVIAGRSGGVEDAVVDRETGVLVDPESLEEIQNAIIELFNDPQLMDKLGVQGKARVLNEFQWSNQIKKLINIL